jgi:carbon-monoxide dehydrogenase large subunit
MSTSAARPNLLIDFTQRLRQRRRRSGSGAAPPDREPEAAPRRRRHAPIEPRGLIASFDPMTEVLTSSTPHPARPRGRYLHHEDARVSTMNRIRVVAPDVGGGFGAKFILYSRRGGGLGREPAVAAPGEMDRRPPRALSVRRSMERDQYWDVEVGLAMTAGCSAHAAR